MADLQVQLDRQRLILNQSFARMEASMASLQQSGSFLTQQIDAMNASNN